MNSFSEKLTKYH